MKELVGAPPNGVLTLICKFYVVNSMFSKTIYLLLHKLIYKNKESYAKINKYIYI
jgi:hypothetical protein